MTTLGELFFGKDVIDVFNEMEEALEFLELFEEDKTIEEKEMKTLRLSIGRLRL